MTRWIWRIAVFVLAAAIFAAALAPARVFLRPVEGRFTYERVEGSIWQATIYGARIGGLDAGDVHVRTSLFDLARGALAADAQLRGRQLNGDVRIVRGLGGVLEIASPLLTVADAYAPGLGMMPGRTTAQGLKLAFAQGVCRSAEGRLQSEAFVALAGAPLSGAASCVGEAAELALAGEQAGDALRAWLELDGDGTGRWRLSARTQQPRRMAALVASGFAPGGEIGALVKQGEFAWLAF